MILILSLEWIEATALREALERTFEQRARQPLPEELPPPHDGKRRTRAWPRMSELIRIWGPRSNWRRPFSIPCSRM